jgi:hypothetical protein
LTLDEPVPVRGRTTVDSTPLDRCQCHPCMCVSTFYIVYAAIYYPFMVVGAIFTLCGFPCNSDSLPPLMCHACYVHRRQMVRALDADESRCCTRTKATFCCYCSEVQVWREIKASGVWPGQMFCWAWESDRAYMSRNAVRGRYSVDGDYAVEATTAEGTRLLSGLRERILDDPVPNLCYRMK